MSQMQTAPRDVEAERADIDREVEGRTLCHLFADNARNHASEPAISWKEGDTWRTMTWREYRDRVAEVAMGLRSLGVGKGDFVALMTRNRAEHVIADLGAVHAAATPVSFYNTLAPEQIAYIAGHCEAKVAVVEGREYMERWEKVRAELPSLQTVVMVEDHEEFSGYDWVVSWDELVRRGREAVEREGREAFERMWKEVAPEDLITLVYTSGTTGPPKAVMITHRNVMWTVSSLNRAMCYPTGMRGVSYLPLAHIAERMATHYLAMYKVAHIHYCPDVLKVFEVVPEVRPDGFLGVPRVWEKVQAGIMAKLAEEPNPRRRRIALGAVGVGRRVAELRAAGRPVPLPLRLKHALADRVVLSKIRRRIGLDRCVLAVTTAAPTPRDTMLFFEGIGVPLLEIYGMTEDTGPATGNTHQRRKIGSAGEALPGVELRLLDDGELVLRGGVVAAGYYKDRERTAETFDAGGWLHTGDIATIDEDGFVRIVDRKKELIITAGGKNISPANLEGLLKRHPLIAQACVVGDGRPYPAALVVLDGEVAPGWARDNGVPLTSIAELAEEPRVVAEVQRAVDEANQRVSRVEQIKRFAILPDEWTLDSEELTPTLKLKRRVIHQKYAEQIESLYP